MSNWDNFDVRRAADLAVESHRERLDLRRRGFFFLGLFIVALFHISPISAGAYTLQGAMLRLGIFAFCLNVATHLALYQYMQTNKKAIEGKISTALSDTDTTQATPE